MWTFILFIIYQLHIKPLSYTGWSKHDATVSDIEAYTERPVVKILRVLSKGCWVYVPDSMYLRKVCYNWHHQTAAFPKTCHANMAAYNSAMGPFVSTFLLE